MVIGFSKIMVGIDSSEKSMEAAEYVISIAKMYSAELTA
jgi:nucleotide-binding universal stress UspA family protein